MELHTECSGYWLSGADAGASFDTKIDTITKPSGTQVLDLNWGGVGRPVSVPNIALINALGIGANDTTFDFRVWGWASVHDLSKTPPFRELWHPTLLGGFTATLNSSLTGVAGAAVPATTYYADTLVIKTGEGTANVSQEIISVPGVHAYIKLDICGFWLVEFECDMTGATSGAFLVKTF